MILVRLVAKGRFAPNILVFLSSVDIRQSKVFINPGNVFTSAGKM